MIERYSADVFVIYELELGMGNRDETVSVCSKLLTILALKLLKLKEIKWEFYIKIKINARTKENFDFSVN